MYDVYAVEDPYTGCEKKIGYIKLKGKMYDSYFADKYLFF